MDAWRAQYEAWRVEHEAWRRQQADAERTAREEERDCRREQLRAFRAEAARLRAERRAAKPRTSITYVLVVTGLALIVAVATGLAFPAQAPARGMLGAVLAGAVAGLVILAVPDIADRVNAALSPLLLRTDPGWIGAAVLMGLGIAIVLVGIAASLRRRAATADTPEG